MRLAGQSVRCFIRRAQGQLLSSARHASPRIPYIPSGISDGTGLPEARAWETACRHPTGCTGPSRSMNVVTGTPGYCAVGRIWCWVMNCQPNALVSDKVPVRLTTTMGSGSTSTRWA